MSEIARETPAAPKDKEDGATRFFPSFVFLFLFFFVFVFFFFVFSDFLCLSTAWVQVQIKARKKRAKRKRASVRLSSLFRKSSLFLQFFFFLLFFLLFPLFPIRVSSFVLQCTDGAFLIVSTGIVCMGENGKKRKKRKFFF